MTSRLLRPHCIGTRRKRLVGAEIRGIDLGEDEVLRWNRTPRQTAQQRQLARVGHRIGKGTLQQDFRSRTPKLRAHLNVPRDIGERFVEMADRGLKVGKCGCMVAAADKEGARVAQHAVHVPDQFVRRSDLRRGAE